MSLFHYPWVNTESRESPCSPLSLVVIYGLYSYQHSSFLNSHPLSYAYSILELLHLQLQMFPNWSHKSVSKASEPHCQVPSQQQPYPRATLKRQDTFLVRVGALFTLWRRDGGTRQEGIPKSPLGTHYLQLALSL